MVSVNTCLSAANTRLNLKNHVLGLWLSAVFQVFRLGARTLCGGQKKQKFMFKALNMQPSMKVVRLPLFKGSTAKDIGRQNHKAECAGQKRRRLAHRSANVAMLEEIRLPGLLLLKKKSGSLCSATKTEKILERGLLNGLLNPVEKKTAAVEFVQKTFSSQCGSLMAHKNGIDLVPPLFVGFYLRSKCRKFHKRRLTRALT